MIADLFNLNRFWLLLWNDLRASIRNLGLLMLCIAGLYVGMSVRAAYYGFSYFKDQFLVLLPALCVATLFGGGLIFTIRAFRELHERNVRTFHLSLPVNRLERLTEKWLLTGILFPVAIVLSFVLIGVISLLVVRVSFHAPVQFTDHIAFIYSRWFRYALGAYLVIQPIFLLGSAWFASKALLKTLAALAGLIMILYVMIYATLGTAGRLTDFESRMVFHSKGETVTVTVREYGTSRSPEWSSDVEARPGQSTASSHVDDSFRFESDWLQLVVRLWKVYGLVLFPVFCLVTTYIRLGELED